MRIIGEFMEFSMASLTAANMFVGLIAFHQQIVLYRLFSV